MPGMGKIHMLDSHVESLPQDKRNYGCISLIAAVTDEERRTLVSKNRYPQTS
ncbi:MAG: hypothetical protein IBJ00_04185 [Alphaproteobacteria bacterium]|nr:hypothetical protein [Alphaproteobacteria bacterium]